MRSGWFNYTGHTNSAGLDSYLWSLRTNQTDYFAASFDVIANSVAIDPSWRNERYHGFPVRCLVR